MRTALICHHDNLSSREILPAWLASFSDLCAIVVIQEPRRRMLRRLRVEARRSGFRLLDVLAFRAYYRARFSRRDAAAIAAWDATLVERFGAPPAGVPVLFTHDANAPEVSEFLARARPDITLARCKSLLKPEVFDVPTRGTVVVHPGICPEYRNAHGCFWALARRDVGRVGATLLRIDSGVDTGPVLGYFTTSYDELRETHISIQYRVVFENLDEIAHAMETFVRDELEPIDTTGRESRAWGQPRLSDWLRWKRGARRATRTAVSPHEGHAG